MVDVCHLLNNNNRNQNIKLIIINRKRNNKNYIIKNYLKNKRYCIRNTDNKDNQGQRDKKNGNKYQINNYSN